MGNCLKPITTRVRNARSGVNMPKGMEISMNADGSGGAVPEVNQKLKMPLTKNQTVKCDLIIRKKPVRH